MEPEELALLQCLEEVLLSTPAQLWTKEDRLCVQGFLQEAISSTGLTSQSKTAARRIFAALVEVDTQSPIASTGSFLHLKLEDSSSNGMRVSSIKPNVRLLIY